MDKKIKFFILNTKTGENIVRDLTTKQIAEVVRDGFDVLVPFDKKYQNAR